jgi:diguanylate cyclase (GGDEF)-like protein
VLDTVTLRVAFGLIALCVLVLFYAGTYRSTRSAFSGWWVLSLLCFLLSAGLFLLNGTPLQGVANPLGNTFGVAGAGCVWAAASSLEERRASRTWLVVPPLVVLAASLLSDPAHDVWAGGAFFLAGMSGYFVLGTYDLWLLWRSRPRGAHGNRTYDAALLSMTISSAVVAIFYFVRLCLFLAVGPDSSLFKATVGAQVTTLMLTLLLVTVTFNMSALAQSQLTRELQLAASQDPLTGLLNRAAFQQRVEELAWKSPGPSPVGYVVMSDFDDFKLLNDHYGHATGDAALAAFGTACRAELRAGDLAARLGGDEFALLLQATPDRTPEETLTGISRRLAAGAARGAHPLPTVSFGIAELDPEAGLDVCLARADAALYKAKGSGFGNVVRADG